MPFNSPTEEAAFGPLLETLSGMLLRLQNRSAPLVVAATSLKLLKKQALPDHCRATLSKKHGPRVSVRGPRHLHSMTRLVLARWPQDHQLESAVPALVCVLSGQADFYLANYLLHCQAGDFVFIPAGVPKPDADASYIVGDAQRQCRLLWISPGPLNGLGLECWIVHSQGNESRSGLDYGTAAIKNEFLARLFDRMSQELQGARQPELEYSLLNCLLLCVLREIGEGRAAVPYTRRLHHPVEREQNMAEEARRHIEARLDSRLTINSMAQLLAVSPSTFARRFREGTGQSFNQYLTEQRMKGAISLLQDTDLAVVDVARLVGLKYERLRDLFQRRRGCSPGQFRQREK